MQIIVITVQYNYVQRSIKRIEKENLNLKQRRKDQNQERGAVNGDQIAVDRPRAHHGATRQRSVRSLSRNDRKALNVVNAPIPPEPRKAMHNVSACTSRSAQRRTAFVRSVV